MYIVMRPYTSRNSLSDQLSTLDAGSHAVGTLRIYDDEGPERWLEFARDGVFSVIRLGVALAIDVELGGGLSRLFWRDSDGFAFRVCVKASDGTARARIYPLLVPALMHVM